MKEKLKAIFAQIGILYQHCCSIPADKLLHIIAGMVAALFFVFIVEETAPGCAMFSAAVGIAREMWNAWRGGKFDLLDLLATTGGGLVVNIFVWI